jgi:glyoxylase-like metal-dependent hydrolase (beta-lactamase superfamily II)
MGRGENRRLYREGKTMHIQHFFDERTGTVSYVVDDGSTCIVIDPIRNYDPKNARTSWAAAQAMADYIESKTLSVAFVIDTHAHADHMSGLPFFKQRYGAQTVTGANIGEVQKAFLNMFDLAPEFRVDGSQFDILIDEGAVLRAGTLEVVALHTPGHTPAHMSWKIGDAVFLGDTLFMPDYGSARCDFPGGSAGQLFDSIQRIYNMPDTTRLFVCHDYRPGGRPLAFQSTVAEQKEHNIQINKHTTKNEYIAFRDKRDAALAAPALILPSIQVNIRAGELPEPSPNGHTYLSIPLNALGS